MAGEAALGRLVVARSGQGEIVAVGKVVAYVDRPTMTIEQTDGKQIHWIADMCSVVDLSGEEVSHLFDPLKK